MKCKYLSCVGLVAFCLSFLLAASQAAESIDKKGILFGVDLGGGAVRTSASGDEQTESAHYLGFRIHNRINSRLSIGIELSGWSLEASNLYDPSKGEAISQIFIVTHYHPVSDSGFFLKAGGGYVNYWNNRPGESTNNSGAGVIVGGGYDYPLKDRWTLSPFALFGISKTSGDDHDAWALGVGIAYEI